MMVSLTSKIALFNFSLLLCNFGICQFCKTKIIDRPCFFYEYNVKLDCEEESKKYYYKWSGYSVEGLIDGRGILTTFDLKDNEILIEEEVRFKKGFYHGESIIKDKDIYGNNIIEKNYYENGKVKYVTKDIYGLFSNYYIYYDLETNYCVFNTIGKGGYQFNLLWTGVYERNLRILTGKCFSDNQLFEEGEFKVNYDAEMDIAFPLTYYGTLSLKSGTHYLESGVKIKSDNFVDVYPKGCATIFFPNGDQLYSCDFNYSIRLNGSGIYYWQDGRKFVGIFSDTKITSKGYFYDKYGNKKYGSFPQLQPNHDNVLGIAALGLSIWGIYELGKEMTKNNKERPEEKNKTKNYSSTKNYTGSYSENLNNGSRHPPKCGDCNGRGVCTKCNGRGSIMCWLCDGRGFTYGNLFNPGNKVCNDCDGKGIIKCTYCNGSGSCFKCRGKGVAY